MVQNDQSSTRNNQRSESASASIAAAAAVKLMNNGKPQPSNSIQLQHQNSDASNKRVARKGSSASRTSRSRTSPRVSNRAGMSSSDEGMIIEKSILDRYISTILLQYLFK